MVLNGRDLVQTKASDSSPQFWFVCAMSDYFEPDVLATL